LAFRFLSTSLVEAKTLACFAVGELLLPIPLAFAFRLVIIAHPPLLSSTPSPTYWLGALALPTIPKCV
jgi:hypothetical protein